MEKVKIYRNIAKVNDIDLFYFDTKGEGEVILCLHGRWGRAETWYDFINHYGKEYRIIAPDQRGHGLSSKPISKYSSEEMAKDIIEFLNSLNISSAIIVGHSMGGSIAGYLAAEYPKYVKGVAILDKSSAGSKDKKQQPINLGELKDKLTKDWPLPFATLNEASNFIKHVSKSDLEYQYFMNSLIESMEGYSMMFSSQAMAANSAFNEDWFNLLPKIKSPALLVKSKGNASVPMEEFEKMKSLIPNCLAYEMSHPDHNVHLANKEEFYGYFDEFLKRI